MKIVQAISHYVPAYGFGGPLQVAHGLGRELVRAGHEVVVCCTNLKNAEGLLDVPTGEPIMVDGVTVFYEPVGKIGRYWGYSPSLYRRLVIEASKAHVVFSHFHFQYASVAGAMAARTTGRPLVVFTHGSLNRHGLTARGRLRKAVYLALLEARNFRAARFVAYHSPFELKMSRPLGRTTIVPIGLDVPPDDAVPPRGDWRRRQPSLGDGFVFAYLGRLAPGKGLDMLIPAFSRVQAGPNPRLLLIGGDERGYEQLLRTLVKRHGLEQSVIFAGLLQGADKLAALRDADAFVLPSRSEGTSLATLEAMALRLPVIVTDRMGISDEVRTHACGLVVPYDEEALAGAMTAMFARSDRAEMGQRGWHCARTEFSWRSIALGLMAKLTAGAAL